ncbi:hypothetical protein [Paenibacillus silviterrae]|uniref:hypothetical protein n=1 Tax=Paenibacillus silviterrae TaxID=3242194 RepID=UPI002543E9F9|nr:hypothetical protein [Paenibacillus chinjuensis]
MTTKKNGGKTPILTTAEVKRKLQKLSKEEIIDLFTDTIKSSKDIRAIVTVKLEGERAVAGMLQAFIDQIEKEFFPAKGRARQRVSVVEQLLSSMKSLGGGTPYPFQLQLYIIETAFRFLEENGDLDEDMCLFIGELFEELMQELSGDDSDERYRLYQARLEAIVRKSEGELPDLHYILQQSYSRLKWAEQSSRNEAAGSGEKPAISFAAMKQWLELPELLRKRLLSNVFCGKCLGEVTMKDYTVEVDRFGLLLQGTCATCGHAVARVVD